MSIYRCCNPVLFKHDDGWDIYRKDQCIRAEDGTWVPGWFDDAIVGDAATKREALQEIAELHPMGYCLVTG